MSLLEIVILGLIQGLTEFIPVSSSGHLVVAQVFLSGASDHLFLEFINIGTMLALLVFFRKKIISIVKDIFIHKQIKLAVNLLITAIPAGIIGFMLADFIGSTPFFGSLTVVMCTLFVVGILMVVLEKLPKASPVKSLEKLSYPRALLIGLAQVTALIPGVSRSGSTIIAGRLAGLNAANAAEYSFLASLPIMVGVTVKILLTDSSYLFDNLGMLVLGNTLAFISGLFAVGFLMKYLASHSLAVFGWYRIGLAGVLLVIILAQAIH